MLSLNKSTKTIDIKIVDEKYYFPSQTIKGIVHVQPKSATKTNHVLLKFTGEISLSMKEKDTITLFEQIKVINVNSDDEQAKFCIMEPKPYTFPFEFVVPDDIHLPSTMEFNKKVKVRYMLSALHDKYMVPESLCPKTEYPVHILELIDINDGKYKEPLTQYSEMFLPISNPMNRCTVEVSLPRNGFTRGDIIPLSMIVHHYEPFNLPQAISINLIRMVEIRNNKTTQIKEDILKSLQCDLEINGSYPFSQTIKRQLMIPTSTPPSINFRDKLMRIKYKVQVCTQLVRSSPNKKSTQTGNCKVDFSITVGTWPRASIPIDDDDDDENDISIEDTDFFEINNSVSGSESNNNDNSSVISDDRKSSSTYLSQQQRLDRLPITPTKDSFSGNYSSSTITLVPKSSPSSPVIAANELMGRSDSMASKSSNKSHTSYSSYRSNQSWDNSSGSLSRNTSLSTTVSVPESNNATTVAVKMLSPTSETIMMTSAPSVDRSESFFPLHRKSDTTGIPVHPVSTHQHRNSLPENDYLHQPQLPTLIGPSPLKYQNQQPLPYNMSKSSSSITLLPTSPVSSAHHRSTSSSSISLNEQQSPLSPHRTANTTILSSQPTFTSPSTTILLQPTNTEKQSVPKANLNPTLTYDIPTIQRDVSSGNIDDDEEDDDDDDDDDDDFLTIIKRKQEGNLLSV